jgi:DNA-binding beta-propeller fold protein YncE
MSSAGASGPANTERVISGPAGLVVLPDRRELWAGDGDSTVKVIDLQAGTIVAAVATGGTKRADKLAYDPIDPLILITNPDDEPPFVTLISTTTRPVMGKIPFPDATDGVEQPVWDPSTQRFYQAVPETKTEPGGAVAVIDPATRTGHAADLADPVRPARAGDRPKSGDGGGV